jgi:hypothetical protein
MVVLTINKGLLDETGKIVTGQTVSSMSPEKIIYTGGVSEETIKVEKWAKKIGAEFSTFGPSIKKEIKIEPVKITNPFVEELYPEEELDVPSAEEVKSFSFTY